MASRHFSFKTGKVGTGSKHAEYIAGQGKYSEREDVRYLADANLPEWASDGRDFFAAADTNERANGRSYSEIEFAIPRECPDPVAYARQYAEQLLGDRHTYRLAVHDKLAADGDRNVHGHLMFSERRLDGIARDREQFFRRANSKTPEKGGTAKDRQWNDRQHIQALRRGYEGHAKAHGIALDLRSNLAQGLTRPEPKIGPQRKRSAPDRQREARVDDVKHIRSNRKAIAQAKAELTTIEKEERNERIRERRTRAKQRYQAAGVTEVHHLRGIDELPHAADRPQVLLQRDEPGRVAQPEARPDTRLVHELDAQRAAQPVKKWLPELTPEQLASLQKTLEEGSRRVREEAARKATAAKEREARPERRKAWQAKHIKRPAIALAAGTPPQPGKPKFWEYSDGPAKGKPAVIDYGDRLKPAGKTVSDTKVAALLECAKAKGWQGISVSGPADFRIRVAEAAQARGMPVLDRDLQQHLADQQRQAAKAAEQQKPAMPNRTPSPVKSDPPATAKTAYQERFEALAAQRQADAEKAEGERRFKAQMEERKAAQTPAVPASTSKPLSPAQPEPKAQIPTIVGENAPTLKALKEELGKLQNEARLDLSSQIRKCQPEPYSAAQALADAKAQAVAEINAWAKREGNPQAFPANQYEYEHLNGWTRQVDGAKHLLDEHQKTPKPFFGKAKAEWINQEQKLAENLKLWKAKVEERDLKLAKLTAEKLHQVKADHAKREAEKPAKLAQAQTRLKDVQERIGTIERTLKEPHYVREAQQQKERLQGQGRGR